MADMAKNVEEARCPEEGHAAGGEPGGAQRGVEEERCCKVGPDSVGELLASQEQRQVMMADLASPAVSVISISSDEGESAQRHSLGE